MQLPKPKNVNGTKVVNQWGSDPKTSMFKPTQFTRDEIYSKPNYSPEGTKVSLDGLGRNSGSASINRGTGNKPSPKAAGSRTGTYNAK